VTPIGLPALGCIVAAAVLVSGCSLRDSGSAEPPEPPIALVIRSSAAAAASEAGLNLRLLLTRSAEEVYTRVPSRRRVRVEVKVEPSQQLVIPETGVGGSFDGRDVRIAVERPLRPGSRTWLRALLAHELHHASRFPLTKVRSRGTLGEALVTEGLADHFADEVFPATPPKPWNHALSRQQEAALWRRARPLLWKPGGYDHRTWFFGGSIIPRWTGYTLGYRIVASYLHDGRRASDVVGVDARAVIAAYSRGRSDG
jgi:hypothetical protein